MNKILNSEMIEFTGGASKFTPAFIESYKKLQELSKNGNMKVGYRNYQNVSDDAIRTAIDEENAYINGQLQQASDDFEMSRAQQAESNPELADVDGQMNIMQFVDGADLTPESGFLDDNSHVSRREWLEDLLEYRQAVRSVVNEMDTILRHMEVNFKDTVVNRANGVLKDNAGGEDMTTRLENNRIRVFLNEYDYFKNLVDSFRNVIPSKFGMDGMNYVDNGQYDVTPEQLDDLIQLADNYNGLDQLQMEMEYNTENLEKDFSKPRIEFEVVDNNVEAKIYMNGRKFKLDEKLDLNTVSLAEAKKTFDR